MADIASRIMGIHQSGMGEEMTRNKLIDAIMQAQRDSGCMELAKRETLADMQIDTLQSVLRINQSRKEKLNIRTKKKACAECGTVKNISVKASYCSSKCRRIADARRHRERYERFRRQSK